LLIKKKNMSENRNLIYYLGAGASAQAVPVVNQTDTYLELLRSYIAAQSNLENKKAQKLLIENIQWIQKNKTPSETVDTFARRLSLQQKSNELMRVKSVLSFLYTFLMYTEIEYSPWKEGLIKQSENRFSIDPRYNSFLANIAHNARDEIMLPENISIVSWNYDIQLEACLYQYTGKPAHEVINTCRIGSNKVIENKPGIFSMIKLNGTAGYRIMEGAYEKPWKYYSDMPDKTGITKRIDELLQFHWSSLNGDATNYTGEILLNFAWEDKPYQEEMHVAAKTIVQTCSHLIIVGYSFPFFNRDIDRQILSEMQKIEMIYIQEPTEASFRKVRSRVRSFLRKELHERIEHIDDVSDFFIPYDY